MRSARKNRGSVVLLVVGLLTIIAMLGSTFVLVARLDRRQSRAIADGAPIRGLAEGIFALIVQDRLDDLYINLSGPYGRALTIADMIDYPHDSVDPGLASIQTTGPGAHRSRIGDLTETTIIVDTDGDGEADSYLCDTGLVSPSGGRYYVAYRVIDGSGLINVNTAYSCAAIPVQDSRPTSALYVSLAALTNEAISSAVHNKRVGTSGSDIWNYLDGYIIRALAPKPPSGKYLPYDVSDMLGLRWLGAGETSTGRLYDVLGTAMYNSKRQYLTTSSSSRVLVPVRVTGETAQTHKADLNTAGYNELFNAFFNAIPRNAAGLTTGGGVGEQDRKRKILAAQLAANVIDFIDGNSDMTVVTKDSRGNPLQGAGGKPATIYGVERQPFVTEAFGKKYTEVPANPGDPPKTNSYWAVELFNPYTTPINLGNYKITSSGGDANLSGTLAAGKRVVLVSDAGVVVVNTEGTKLEISSLELTGGAKIYRSAAAGGDKKIRIANIPAMPVPMPPEGEKRSINIIWHDELDEAHYTRTIQNTLPDNDAHDYTNKDLGSATPASTRLGRSNTDLPAKDGEPCPVYVRNGMMINLGDLCRIFYVGPSETKSLREQLGAGGNYAVGRLDPAGSAGNYGDARIADIPVGALLTNYVMVGSPMADTIDNDDDGRTDDPANPGMEDSLFGRINVNTAPSEVLMCLPGMPTGNPRAAANLIVTYRARNDVRGFASPGEVAIPLSNAGQLPHNRYSTIAPDNYAIAGVNDDDGLSLIQGKGVRGDLTKYRVYYNWLSNHITVRSDVFIAYIRVQVGNSATATRGVRYYIGVVDRSNCRTENDRPIVHMFSRVK